MGDIVFVAVGINHALHLLRPHPLHAGLEGRLLLLRALPVRLALRALRVGDRAAHLLHLRRVQCRRVHINLFLYILEHTGEKVIQ